VIGGGERRTLEEAAAAYLRHLEHVMEPKRTTLQDYRGYLRRHLAIKREWARTNPVALVDRPRSHRSAHRRIRFVQPEELETVLRAVPDDHLGAVERPLYLAAAMTGLRQGELAHHFRVARPGDEHAVGSGLDIGGGAFERGLDGLGLVQPVGVDAGVDEHVGRPGLKRRREADLAASGSPA
jgi:hypothetical protein